MDALRVIPLTKTMAPEDLLLLGPQLRVVDANFSRESEQHPARRWEYALAMKAVQEFEYQRGKDWSKVPIWEARFKDLAVDPAVAPWVDNMPEPHPSESSSAERWTLTVLPAEKRKDQLEILGPCQRPEHLLGDFLQQLVYE